MIISKFIPIRRILILNIRQEIYCKAQYRRFSTNDTNNQNNTMAAQIFDDNKFTGVRLPTSVKPVHYDLKLIPSFTDFTFEGDVKIQLEGSGAEATNSVVLHSHELKINDGSLDKNALKSVTYSKETETATLEFNDAINPKGTLHLNFTGTLNDKMKGFYRTAFKIGDATVHAATTQFEATDARRCFPCWDEPAIKATFSVSLVVDTSIKVGDKQYEQLALSNMNEIARNPTGSKVEVKFEKTPIMSTYLLAFIVGPFEMIEGTDGHRPIRVYTTPGKKEQGRFALEVACKSLPFYEDYFGIKYPLPKMDLIAIPDFTSGAMENWGLVTYRESCLLVDEGNTATNTKQWIAIVVAHELAHQWFGNLVTMEWWTHLWLNEGFASFMEFLCVDHIFPEYDIWSQFVTDAYAQAMSLDSLHNSHPIEVPVKHPSEIDEIFDIISYKKGSSVIRMLYTYIGDANFRKGMKDYLTKFAYKNASTEDLWDCLELASKMPVRQLMSGWTAQKGYPWLEVGYAKQGDSVKLTLKQDKFSSDGKVPEDEASLSWWVPISAVNGSNPTEAKEVCVLKSRSSEIVIDGVGDNWVKLNPGTIGLYRTAYPEEMTTKLFSAISTKSLPPMDRLGLQDDFYALCRAGKVSTVDLLRLLQAFKDEDDYTVWSSIDSCLGRLSIVLSHTDYKKKFQSFGRELYRDIFRKLTWTPRPNEKHTDALTRALVLNRLVSFGDEEVIGEALKRYKAHLDKTTLIPADLRSAVYRAVSAYGDDELFESLFDLYKTAELHEEKDRAARALGFSQTDARLKKVIEFAMTDEVRNQDKVFFLIPIGVNRPPVAWKFLQDNKDLLREIYESGHLMARLIKYVTENFASEDMAQEVASFFEKNKFPGAERTVQQSLESIRLNAGWLARDAEKVREFLASY